MTTTNHTTEVRIDRIATDRSKMFAVIERFGGRIVKQHETGDWREAQMMADCWADTYGARRV